MGSSIRCRGGDAEYGPGGKCDDVYDVCRRWDVLVVFERALHGALESTFCSLFISVRIPASTLAKHKILATNQFLARAGKISPLLYLGAKFCRACYG